MWGSLFAAGQLLDSQRKKMLGIFDTALDELHNFLGDQAGRLVVTIVRPIAAHARSKAALIVEIVSGSKHTATEKRSNGHWY